MITDILLSLLYWILIIITAPLRLFPDAQLPVEITGAIGTGASYIMFFEDLVPIQNILQALGLILGLEGAIIAWRIANWTLRRIPGQS